MTGREILDSITGEDIFLRPEAFEEFPWYGQFRIFLSIGVCCVPREEVDDIRRALLGMGYETHTKVKPGEAGVYVVGGAA